MRCVILAGGLGTRMRPRTENLPKSLLSVNGVPFIHHQLSLLAGEGVTEVVFCIGHLGAQVREVVGDGSRWGLRVAYVDEGSDLRGTAGALRLAVEEGAVRGRFFVLYGDSYLPIAYRPVWEAACSAADPVMTVHRNEGRWDASNVVFEDGQVRLYEKGRTDAKKIGMRHIDYGLSVLDEGVVLNDDASDLADVLHRLSLVGRLRGYEVETRFYEIGSPAGLAELEVYLSTQE